jgi:crossover junction endodeoxyribonuclease RuvC
LTPNPLAARILGIDPGLRNTGFAVLDHDSRAVRYVASGAIKTGSGELPQRIGAIVTGILTLIDEYHPTVAAIEKVFVNVNPQSTLLLGQARGAALSGLVLRELPVFEYTALQVKQAVVGHGKAHKSQVQEMVKRLLNLRGDPNPDAADALACAICHAHGGNRMGIPEGALAARGLRVRGGRLVDATAPKVRGRKIAV